MAGLPAPPPGFVLDKPEVPPPPGFILDTPEHAMLEEPEHAGSFVPRPVAQFMSGVNRGLFADFVGAPVDLVNAGLSLAGLESDEPFMGSRFLRGLLGKIGATPEPEGSTIERVGREVGFGVGAAVPIISAAGRVQQGIRATEAVGRTLTPAQQIGKFAGQRPLRFLAAETTAATGGGLGVEFAHEVDPDSPLAEFLGRLGGSFTITLIPNLARTGLKTAASLVKGVGPFTPKGRRLAAARLLKASALDPGRAADNLKAQPPTFDGAIFTTAQLADDDGLLALERGVIRSNAQLGGRFRDIEGQLNRAARNEINQGLAKAGGNPSALAEFMAGRVNRVTAAISERIDSAKVLARRTIRNLTPVLGKAEASKAARAEIEAAYREARGTEREIWNSIHKGAPVDTDPIRAIVRTVAAEARKADAPDNFPQFLNRLFAEPTTETVETGVLGASGRPVTRTVTRQAKGAFRRLETVDELMGLRSRLLFEIRRESAKEAPNRVRIRNLERVNEAVIDSLASVGGRPAAEARAYSLTLNDRFTRGPIGSVLGFTVQGGKRVAADVTLKNLFARGEAGGVNADAIARAVEDNPKALDAVGQFVRQRFVETTEDAAGKINAGAAAKFLRDHDDFLKRFPALRTDLREAARGLKRADDIVRTNVPRSDMIRKQSRAALFLNTDDPVRVVDQVLRSGQSVRGLRELAKQAAKDTSGFATEGLKSAVVEAMFRRVQLRTLDNAGVEMLSAANMRVFLAQNRQALARSGLFKGQELARLETVARALNIAERSMTSKIRGGSDTAQNVNVLTDMMVRLLGGKLGAQSGRRAGVSPLVMAQAGVRSVRRLFVDWPERKIAEVVNRAIFDPDLMQTLLVKPTEKAAPIIIRRLRGHLLNVAPELTEEPEANAP